MALRVCMCVGVGVDVDVCGCVPRDQSVFLWLRANALYKSAAFATQLALSGRNKKREQKEFVEQKKLC